MQRIHNLQKQKGLRKSLRNNMTEEELILWSRLKGKQFEGYKFRRQHGIGRYIVDFYCPRKRVVVELDGGQHAEDDVREYDKVRQRFIESANIRVLRFWNCDICKNLNDVAETIYRELIK